MNQYLAERQQVKSMNMWTVFTAGEEYKQGSQESCNGTWATSGTKGSWKRSKQGGDKFTDDTSVNHTGRINYILLPKDLTVLKTGKRDGTRNAVLVQIQASESVYTHSLNLHKCAHRLMSKNLVLPVTVGVMEFAFRVLWNYQSLLRRGHKRQAEN